MRNIFKATITCVFLLSHLALSPSINAEEPKHQKPKRVHQHDAKANGKVLMSGDTHLELVRSGEDGVHIYFSDKFREPMKADLFDIKIHLNSKEKNVPLTYTIDTEESNKILVALPSERDSASELEISAPLKVAQKAYVSVANPVKVQLAEVPAQPNGHGNHH